MRKLFLILLLSLVANSFAAAPAQPDVRVLFQKAATEEKSCKMLIDLLQGYNKDNNPVLAGYRACATMMMANYNFNPISKLSNFIKGRNLLEKSIEVQKQNVELRFLRFTIQTNIPSFLGYKSSIQEDKNILINSVAGLQDLQLKQWVTSYLKKSSYLTPAEKQNLKS